MQSPGYRVVGPIANFASSIGSSLFAQKNLDEVREEIAGNLRSLPFTLLVIIDDIDRLTPEETAEMLQLIKANADFPNLVYLVLFDRETVETNITKALNMPGRKYLEKVVQVPFDIPAVEPIKLRRVLSDGLNECLADAKVAQRFDKTRWGNLFLGGLAPYFQTLRTVKRFLSSLSLHVAVFRSEQAFEVNPIDLIALEALRLFEPEVYGLIRKNKAALTELRERGDGAREVVRAIVKAASEGLEAQVEEIVKQLFPPAEWALGGSNYGSEFGENWERDLRVCSEDIFDRYFVLTTPEDQLSETELVNLLASTHDRTAFRTALKLIARDGRLKAALERLEAYKQRIDVRHARAFITALFDVSGDIGDDSPGMFGISAPMHAHRIVYWYLKQDEFNEAERTKVIVDAVTETEGLELPIAFVARELQRQETQPDELFLTPDAMGTLKELCVDKIKNAAADGALILSQEFVSILYNWREWGEESNEPGRFCEELIGTPEGVATLLERFEVQSYVSSDHVYESHRHVKLSDIEPFVPVEALQEKVASLDRKGLSDDQLRVLTAFEKAVRRHEAGGREDDLFLVGDD